MKVCLRCAKKGIRFSTIIHFCDECKDHFHSLVYLDGDQIGKYGSYCRGHYWNGERMMTTTFSITTMKAFQSDPYTILKRNLPIKRKKYPGEMTVDNLYREMYMLELADRAFLNGMAEFASRYDEPLF